MVAGWNPIFFKHPFHILHFPDSTELFTKPIGWHYTKYRFSPDIAPSLRAHKTIRPNEVPDSNSEYTVLFPAPPQVLIPTPYFMVIVFMCSIDSRAANGLSLGRSSKLTPNSITLFGQNVGLLIGADHIHYHICADILRWCINKYTDTLDWTTFRTTLNIGGDSIH